MCHTAQDLEPLRHEQLEDVWGGYDLQRNVDQANSMARSTIEAGGYIGAGIGAVTGYFAHRKDATTFLGISKARIPIRITATGVGVFGGAITTGLAGWGVGAYIDAARQYRGEPPAGGGGDG